MSVRCKDTEYTYISAKVRALETALVGRETLSRMLEAKSTADAMVYLREHGFSTDAVNASERENNLLEVFGAGLDAVEKSAPMAGEFAFFRYPYDCSNIKSAIKCGIRGIACDGMLFSIGSVPPEKIKAAYESRDFSVLPENMAKAAREAISAYAATKNPQNIDFILDCACFADMDACAKRFGVPFIVELVNSKADLTNFTICLRVLRMECGAYGEKLAAAALNDSGRIGKDKFIAAFVQGEDALLALISKNGYRTVADKLKSGGDLELTERVCDNYRMELAISAKRVTYGPSIPTAYLLALEYEIQNIRIILAGKDAGLSPAKIGERLRESYV